MRIALLVVAGLALVGFIVVAFVLPQLSESEAKEAAQALGLVAKRVAKSDPLHAATDAQ